MSDAKIPTFTGKRFDVLEPDSRDVDIRDIAHGLSQECRYSSQSKRFYSVAEHSIFVSRAAFDLATERGNPDAVEVAVWGLLHDASEAYGLRDLPTPVVKNASWGADYKKAHNRVMSAVVARFDLLVGMPDEVREADERIVMDEWPHLVDTTLPFSLWRVATPEPLSVALEFARPEVAKEQFLRTWDFLSAMRRPYPRS